MVYGIPAFKLKKDILEETKRAYGEKAFDRWRKPLYEGALANPDGYACLRSSCGDSMELFLQFDGERVSRASFRTAGCGAGAVCGASIVQPLDVVAPGNGAPIGGLKVVTENGWFAARPSGTEDIYKLYAESFKSEAHLDAIVAEAQNIVRNAL